MPDEIAVTTIGLVSAQLSQLHGDMVRGLTEVRASLEGKADKTDLAEIRGELRGHHDRIASLEDSHRSQVAAEATRSQLHAGRLSRRQALWASIVAVLTIAAMISSPFIAAALASPHHP